MKLTEPTMKYTQQIMAYRKEFLDRGVFVCAGRR